jgi:hypothetical protein
VKTEDRSKPDKHSTSLPQRLKHLFVLLLPPRPPTLPVKTTSIPLQAWTGPEAPRFQNNRHMKVVRLSALRIGRLYPPGNIPGTHFC